NGDSTNDVMLRRFGDRKDQFEGGLWGGDLAGTIQKIDYIADLGITTLFLNPIVTNDRNDFFGFLPTGYRPRDYFDVDENFGTVVAARSLVEMSHQRGTRVVLDLPLSLCGIEHHYNSAAYRDDG